MHPEKVDSAWRPELSEMVVRLVRSDEQRRYQQLMRAHHYLGYLPKIGETLWYVATWREQWLALLSFSGSALKCAVRDRWIGWTLRQHYGRLKLVVNNSRFLILPDGHLFNLGSRVLSLCQRRLPGDWEEAFGHGVVLLETFVDPQRHCGTVYRAAMAPRIDKGFQQHHAVPESFFPIPGQTPLTERENARPQVEEVPVRKNQEAAVVDYQLQAAVVLAQGPTNPAIAHGALQSRARKTQQGEPLLSPGRHVP